MSRTSLAGALAVLLASIVAPAPAHAAPDSAVVEFAVESSEVVEAAGGDHLVTVIRAVRLQGSVSVTFATVDGTAVAGSDYVATSGVVTFPNRSDLQQIVVPILDDELLEADEAFGIELTMVEGNAVLGALTFHTVTILNDDSSTNRAPVLDAVGDQVVAEGEVSVVGVSGSDPDGDAVSFAVSPWLEPWGSFVDNADGTATLTLAPGFEDAGVFGPYTISISDGTLTDTEDITITVTDTNRVPVADDQSVVTPPDTPIAITLTGSDPDGDPITFAVDTPPTNGTLSGTAPDVTYTPNPGFVGTDSFLFTTNDGALTSAAATVTIDVTAGGQPITPTVLSVDSDASSSSATTPSLETTAGTLTVVTVTNTAGVDPATVLSASGVTFSLVVSDAPTDPAARQISIYETTDALSGPISITVDDGRKIRWAIVNFGQAEVAQSASTTYKVTNDTDLAVVGLNPFSSPDSVTYTALYSQKLPVVEPGYTMLGQEGTSAVLSAAWLAGEDTDPSWTMNNAHWIILALEIGPQSP